MAAMPPMPGIIRSSTTASGCWASTIDTASSPLDASPTTVNPWAMPNAMSRMARTGSSSSATTTRNIVPTPMPQRVARNESDWYGAEGLFHPDVVREAQNPLGDDVALHLRGAATDGERGGEEVPVVPVGTPRTGGEHALGAAQVLGQPHDVLPVLVGQRLAHRRFRARLLPLHGGADRPQADEPQHLGLHVQPGQPLPHDRVVAAA